MCDLRAFWNLSEPRASFGDASLVPASCSSPAVKDTPGRTIRKLKQASILLLCVPRWGPVQDHRKGSAPRQGPSPYPGTPGVVPSLCAQATLKNWVQGREAHVCTHAGSPERQDRASFLRPGRCSQSERALSSLSFCFSFCYFLFISRSAGLWASSPLGKA